MGGDPRRDAKTITPFHVPQTGVDKADAAVHRPERQKFLEKLAAQDAQMEALLQELEDTRKTATTAQRLKKQKPSLRRRKRQSVSLSSMKQQHGPD